MPAFGPGNDAPTTWSMAYHAIVDLYLSQHFGLSESFQPLSYDTR